MRRYCIARVVVLTSVAFAACLVSSASRAGDNSDKMPKVELSREERIEQALDRQCQLALQDTTLENLVVELEKQYRIASRLDLKSLMEAGVQTEMTVTLQNNSALATELDRALRPLDITFIIRHESLLITTKTAAECSLEARVYPVRDLVTPSQRRLLGRPRDFSKLIETITSTVHPTTWEQVGGTGSITGYGHAGALVVLQTWEIHREIERLLATIRATNSQSAPRKATPQAQPSHRWAPATYFRHSDGAVASQGVDSNPLRNTARRKIDSVFRTEIAFNIPEVSLDQLIARLSARCRFPFLLDQKSLMEAGIDSRQPTIVWSSANLGLGAAFEMALRDLDLTWLIDDDAVLITTKQAAETRLQTHAYRVSDLIVPPIAEGKCDASRDYESLMEVLTSAVRPTSWSCVGGTGAIEYLPEGDLLIVSQTRDVHLVIEQLLAMLRDVRERQYPMPKLVPLAETATVELPLQIYNMYPKLMNSGGGSFAFNFDDKTGPKPATEEKAPAEPTKPAATAPNVAAAVVDPYQIRAEQLAKAIPELIEPKSWRATGGHGQIFAVGSRLLVRQTCEVHAQIRELLEALNDQHFQH